MQLKDIKAGDVIFFSSDNTTHAFGRQQQTFQRALSLFWCGCCKPDYKRTHVAICVAGAAETGKEAISIAHLNWRNTTDNISRYIVEEFDNRTQRRMDILRPKDQRFTNALVDLAQKGDSSIHMPPTSIHSGPFTRRPPESKKTKAGFSIATNCSKFTKEAIDLAAQSSKLEKHRLEAEDPHVMISVISLWRCLSSSGLYDINPLSNSLSKTLEKKETKQKLDAQTQDIHRPLLSPYFDTSR